MGYMHYVNRPLKRNHNQKDWDLFIKDCIKIFKRVQGELLLDFDIEPYNYGEYLWLSGCYSYQFPIFDKDQVFFNGASMDPKNRKQETEKDGSKYWQHDPKDASHETFVLSRKVWKQPEYAKKNTTLFSFCKTARKPYDIVVCAILLLYKEHFPYVNISSDGDYEDWIPGVNLLLSLFPDKFSEILFGDEKDRQSWYNKQVA